MLLVPEICTMVLSCGLHTYEDAMCISQSSRLCREDPGTQKLKAVSLRLALSPFLLLCLLDAARLI